MIFWKKAQWIMVLGIGLAAGWVASGFLPQTSLHAVSTDRVDTYAIATGPVDMEVEAVYLLDFLTGDLQALVLGKKPYAWGGAFQANVARDLAIDPQKNPKFLMVTGMVDLRRAGGSRQQPSAAVCYIAEITSGKIAAYAIPWSPPMYAAGQPQSGQLKLVGITPFRESAGALPGMAPPVVTPKKR